MEKKIIFYIILIIVILVLVFLGRQAASGAFGKTLISNATNKIGAYMMKASSSIISSIYPKISAEAQKRGELLTNQVNQGKQNVLNDIGNKIENYFSGIKNSVVNPGAPQNCPAPKQ